MKIPCIKKENLEIFTLTADQRYLLGEQIFLGTHSPLKFRRYKKQNCFEEWTDKDLFDRITQSTAKPIGNRTFVLFGAAGSGKSEAIRWLECQLKNKYSDGVVRFSRTELDPMQILEKLLSTIGGELSKDLYVKWDGLRKKPVTLANSIVWNSLSSILESDEEVIPITYKLRPIIEENLRKNFEEVSSTTEITDRRWELISIEELEDVINESAIKVTIDYEHFRSRLIQSFETEVLGGYNFVKTLKHVGEVLRKKTGKRPVLLIDDLVQSMSIYSSDLLDFFITFEEGNWDIIIGLTPASFESTKRGKELLNRINYLDTFDDRLAKLWLTDESGRESYALTPKTASDFIKYYLREYKRLNGFECGIDCPVYRECLPIQWGEVENLPLTPLNVPFINRLFHKLVIGKGHARQLTRLVGDYLTAVIENYSFNFLTDNVHRELTINCSDVEQRVFIESYIPENITGQFTVPVEFLNKMGFSQQEDLVVNITRFNIVQRVELEQVIPDDPSTTQIDPEMYAIRDWLEDKNVNKELLRHLRIALDDFFREFSPVIDFKRPYTSRKRGSFRRDQIIEGCRTPFKIEGIDTHIGIEIKRSLGYLLFQITELKKVKGKHKELLLNQLLSNPDIASIHTQYIEVHKVWFHTFQKCIGISYSELAFLFYVFLYSLGQVKKCPSIVSKNYPLGQLELSPRWKDSIRLFSREEKKFIENFFMDWFLIRENLYDGYKLQGYINTYQDIYQIIKMLSEIAQYDSEEKFAIGFESVNSLIKSALDLACQYNKLFNDKDLIEPYQVVIKSVDELNKCREDNSNDYERYVLKLFYMYKSLFGKTQVNRGLNLTVLNNFLDRFKGKGWEELATIGNIRQLEIDPVFNSLGYLSGVPGLLMSIHQHILWIYQADNSFKEFLDNPHDSKSSSFNKPGLLQSLQDYLQEREYYQKELSKTIESKRFTQ